MVTNELIGNKLLREKLLESVKQNKIPHAQLFTGEPGVGKLAFALEYAKELLSLDNKESFTIKNFQHPDLHFIFPVAINDKVKSKPQSDLFLKQWYDFLKQHPYGSLFDWYQFIGIENKQGQIGVVEAENIVRKLALKSHQGGYQVVIIWGAEKLNNTAANKLLKILEEPPQKTVFILISEKNTFLLPTIRSRVQTVYFKKVEKQEMVDRLTADLFLETDKAKQIAFEAQGNYNRALKIADQSVEGHFESYFISWIRWSFIAKRSPQVLKNLVGWASEISLWGREKQKNFLTYSLHVFHQALLTNYGAESIVYEKLTADDFQWKNFSHYIHGANIRLISEELSKAFYHVERNANPKILFLDLSIKITRFLHLKIKE